MYHRPVRRLNLNHQFKSPYGKQLLYYRTESNFWRGSGAACGPKQASASAGPHIKVAALGPQTPIKATGPKQRPLPAWLHLPPLPGFSPAPLPARPPSGCAGLLGIMDAAAGYRAARPSSSDLSHHLSSRMESGLMAPKALVLAVRGPGD